MKSVAFRMPPKAPDPADAWVQTRAAEPEIPAPAPAEAMKRFTIDVPVSLHTRIKAQCALRGEKMADVIRALLDCEFPKP
jgi:ParG